MLGVFVCLFRCVCLGVFVQVTLCVCSGVFVFNYLTKCVCSDAFVCLFRCVCVVYLFRCLCVFVEVYLFKCLCVCVQVYLFRCVFFFFFRCAMEAAAMASSVPHVTRPSRCGSEATHTACRTSPDMSWLSPPYTSTPVRLIYLYIMYR